MSQAMYRGNQHAKMCLEDGGPTAGSLVQWIVGKRVVVKPGFKPGMTTGAGGTGVVTGYNFQFSRCTVKLDADEGGWAGRVLVRPAELNFP